MWRVTTTDWEERERPFLRYLLCWRVWPFKATALICACHFCMTRSADVFA